MSMAEETEAERVEAQRMAIRVQQSDPMTIGWAKERHAAGRNNPIVCAWCKASVDGTTLYRCQNSRCLGGLPACAPCTLIAHERSPLHGIQVWTDGRYWKLVFLNDLGYVYQSGHDGLPCPNPASETTVETVRLSSGVTQLVSRGCNCT
ncbi:hypothetical protein DFH06DRAFT_1326231 [Mycena polygramma]|nr:hypothetical protein DFH06DRAFT_1326231 [Mycena polygramma]